MLELLLRGVLLVANVAFEWVFGHVFYLAGWLLCRLLSAGHHPQTPLWVEDPLAAGQRLTTALGAVALLVVPSTLLLAFYG